jgi:hypothetical protein
MDPDSRDMVEIVDIAAGMGSSLKHQHLPAVIGQKAGNGAPRQS